MTDDKDTVRSDEISMRPPLAAEGDKPSYKIKPLETAEDTFTEAPRGNKEGPEHPPADTKQNEGAEEATDTKATGEDIEEGPGGPNVEPTGATGGPRPEPTTPKRRAQEPKRVQPFRTVKGQATSKGSN